MGKEEGEVEATQLCFCLFSGSEFSQEFSHTWTSRNIVFKSSYQGDEMMHVFKGKYISSAHFS